MGVTTRNPYSAILFDILISQEQYAGVCVCARERACRQDVFVCALDSLFGIIQIINYKFGPLHTFHISHAWKLKDQWDLPKYAVVGLLDYMVALFFYFVRSCYSIRVPYSPHP